MTNRTAVRVQVAVSVSAVGPHGCMADRELWPLPSITREDGTTDREPGTRPKFKMPNTVSTEKSIGFAHP